MTPALGAARVAILTKGLLALALPVAASHPPAPPQPDAPAGRWYRGIIHAHSTFSDGERSLPALAARAHREGAAFLVVTDHYEEILQREQRAERLATAGATPDLALGFASYRTRCDEASLPGRFVVIPSVEICTRWGQGRLRSNSHLLALALDRRDAVIDSLLSADAGPDTRAALPLARRVRALGFLAVAAHPNLRVHPLGRLIPRFRNDRDFRFDRAAVTAIDGIEMLNSDQHDAQDFAWYLDLLRDGSCPFVTAGADVHLRADEDLRWPRATHVNAASLTRAALLHAIREGRTVATSYVAEIDLHPVPCGTTPVAGAPELRLRAFLPHGMPHRARLRVYRDGQEVPGAGMTVGLFKKRIDFAWRDEHARPGRHTYVLHLPHVLVTSPILVEVHAPAGGG